jgi:hypothetical protein
MRVSGGTTLWDANLIALQAIVQEWNQELGVRN